MTAFETLTKVLIRLSQLQQAHPTLWVSSLQATLEYAQHPWDEVPAEQLAAVQRDRLTAVAAKYGLPLPIAAEAVDAVSDLVEVCA